MENQYEKMSLAELRAVAKEKGMQGITTKKKQELLDLLLAGESSRTKEPAEQRIETVPESAGRKKADTVPKSAKRKVPVQKESEAVPEPEERKVPVQKESEAVPEPEERKESVQKESEAVPEPEERKESVQKESEAVREPAERKEQEAAITESAEAALEEPARAGADMGNASAAEGRRPVSAERPKRNYETRRPRTDELSGREGTAVRNTAPPLRTGGYGRESGERSRPEGQDYRDSRGREYARDGRENREGREYRENPRDGRERGSQDYRDNARNSREAGRDGRSRMNSGYANPYANQSTYQNPHQGQSFLQGQGGAQSPSEQRESTGVQGGQNVPAGGMGYAGGTPQSNYRPSQQLSREEIEQLDSGETKEGILEIMQEGFGFIRCDNFLPGSNDVYVSPLQIRRMNLKTGDIIVGNTKIRSQTEKFSALLYVKSINDLPPAEALKRPRFEELTPIFPNRRIHLETPGCKPSMRMVDLVSPIGKGQRGMIVAQPKAGKTTLLKQIARAVNINHPEMHMIILLIDERPEEVTDMKESIHGDNVEVIYSTFDELPENHKRVSEMVIERAKRLVEHGRDVIILLDSITRLARAYNLTVQSSGRTLSGGLDPAALHMPKKIFGAARNMREGGSLTILATALVETGSRMDDVVFEEFKGTGNMELVLDRNLSERRVFPAIDLPRSSTRRDDLLLAPGEMEANVLMRRAFNGMKSEEAVERIIQIFASTKNNSEFIETIKKTKIAY